MSGGFVRGDSRTMAGLLLVTGLSLAGHRWAKLADPGTENPASR